MRWKWMTIGIAAACLAFAPAAHAQADPVVFTAGPSGPTNNRSPSFGFTAAFPTDCRVEPNPANVSCTSPYQLTDLPDGDYRLVVSPSDTHDPALSATRSFTVDTVPPAPPAITSPADNAVVGASVVLDGTLAADATSVRVSDNDVDKGAATLGADGTWQLKLDGLADGTHVLTATAFDAAGNVSAPATRTVRVDTIAPAVTITSAPPSLTNATPVTIAFTASEAATFTCSVAHSTDVPAPQDCSSPFVVPTPDDGEYRVEITAKDAAGLSSEPVPVTVVVDRSAPAAVAPARSETTFTFAPAESGSSFQCRLEGPSGDSGFRACTSPKAYPDLPPGSYRFTLRTFDEAGNHSDAAPTAFTVAAPPVVAIPEAAPTPAPEPVAIAPPTPTPQAGESVVVRASSGTILVRKPGTTEFVAISRSSAVPLGSEIDARKGKAVLTVEPADGKAFERATFYAGLFVVQQVSGYLELTLSETLAPCKRTKAPAANPKSRKLWGDGKGKFRIKGRSGTATTGGGKWLVEDSCDGTFTRASQGVVSVRDSARRKTVLLRAGRSYLAKPKK
ncbi:Ig-like domain-containing protein [Solirubrobacter ginsenosidimutans]|uniref:Ig-like domain-containing protein n=1 Tax=Solirubrobacter ginsenosidimutans TaxID=490573 RepID=A0A9X3S4P1_9ACTN|nr:Ig-like domain-containing protein [Solirubrobacter ginsenosidimutans]MDA0164687.1 Ig-like domain-containing protein [Solirubrobacter ginsenosidimutans]